MSAPVDVLAVMEQAHADALAKACACNFNESDEAADRRETKYTERARQIESARSAVAELIDAAGSSVGCWTGVEGYTDYFVVRANGEKYTGAEYDRESLAAAERDAWIATALAACGDARGSQP